MKRKARLERETQPVMPPRLGMLDVVGHPIMAPPCCAIRKGIVYRTFHRLKISPMKGDGWYSFPPPKLSTCSEKVLTN